MENAMTSKRSKGHSHSWDSIEDGSSSGTSEDQPTGRL